MPRMIRTVTGSEPLDLWITRIVDSVFRPYEETIHDILALGYIATVVHGVDEAIRGVTRALGARPEDGAYMMPRRTAERLAQALSHDPVARRWLTSGKPNRIFLIKDRGTMLFNYDPATGYTIEPGSLDTEVFLD